jgi:hypothetical protein
VLASWDACEGFLAVSFDSPRHVPISILNAFPQIHTQMAFVLHACHSGHTSVRVYQSNVRMMNREPIITANGTAKLNSITIFQWQSTPQ